MPTPKLNEDQQKQAHALLDSIRKDILKLSAGNPDLAFAFRRKVAKHLSYDERGTPMQRKRLAKQLLKRQGGNCKECGGPLPSKGAIRDRKDPMLGYTVENVELIHSECDSKRQEAKRYTG